MQNLQDKDLLNTSLKLFFDVQSITNIQCTKMEKKY